MQQKRHLILAAIITILCSVSFKSKGESFSEIKTSIEKNNPERQRLIDELNRLKSILSTNEAKQISVIFDLPKSNDSIGIYIDNDSFDMELAKNKNVITESIFIDFFPNISEDLQIGRISVLFQNIDVQQLLQKDLIENVNDIQTEPCQQFYNIKIVQDMVTLSVGTRSNKFYKKKSISEEEIPENSSEFCESILWWTFYFDGQILTLKNISGAG